MASSSTRILSLKTLLIATGVVSIAMVMKFSVPLIMYFAVYEVPVIWSIVLSWLKPPYLYIVINGIIITIAASSRFHQKLDDDDHSEPLVQAKAPPSDLAPVSAQPAFGVLDSLVAYDSDAPILDVKPVVVNGSEVVGDEDVIRVAKQKRHKTLENTWTLKTYGRHVPLTRHLRKSETRENQGRQFHADQSFQNMLKSEVFKDRSNYYPSDSSVGSSRGSGKLRKEASPSQDELYRQAEAFIKEFYEDQRLQRQVLLTRHLRNSETQENHGRQFNADQPFQNVLKSETFKYRTNYDPPDSSVGSSRGSGKLRKEASPSQDEFNRGKNRSIGIWR